MRFSFFCQHCGKHLRKGNHAKCKVILKQQREENAHTVAKTSSESSQRYLAKTGEGC